MLLFMFSEYFQRQVEAKLNGIIYSDEAICDALSFSNFEQHLLIIIIGFSSLASIEFKSLPMASLLALVCVCARANEYANREFMRKHNTINEIVRKANNAFYAAS